MTLRRNPRPGSNSGSRIAALTAAAVVSFAVLVAGESSAASRPSVPSSATRPRNGPIAFVRFQGNFPRIFLMDPDGRHKHRLSATPGDMPAFSPTGTRIALTDERRANQPGRALGRIALMHRDGSHRRILVGGFPSYAPKWAPGGRRLVFMGFKNGGRNSDIFTIKTNGHGLRRLTHGPRSDEAPAFSPNGRLIIFDSVGGRLLNGGLLIMRADGTHRRLLAKNAGGGSFSPSGGKIIYSGEQGPASARREQIFTIRPDGTHRRQLTHNTSHRIFLSGVFSPNGKRIVFDREVGNVRSDLFTMDAHGGHLKRLTHDGGSFGASWGPGS